MNTYPESACTFNVNASLQFERDENGGVTVVINKGTRTASRHHMDEATWISVIAEMSAGGGQAAHHPMGQLHKGIGCAV